VHERFVGRTAQLAEMNGQLALASGQHGRVVLVTGPEGIGKTALILRCLSAWAEHADVVTASGDLEESPMAGGLLWQLWQCRPAAGAEIRAALADRHPDPLAAGSALFTFMRDLASERPLVVAIDDGHWGDELSLKALSYAARRLHSERVLCVIAAQPDYLTRLPSGILRTTASHGLHIELAGLGVGEVAALAQAAGAGSLPGRAARRLRDHTAGVPLHVLELIHDLPADELMTPGLTLPAPRSLATLVLSRLAGCAGDTERLVVAAAVLGSECELADAAALAQLSDPLPAFQEAVEQRLLVEQQTAGRRRCSFPHALIRTAIYRDIGVSRRAVLHWAAAELTSGSAALAHRAAGCSGTDMKLAEDLVARAANEEAAGQLAEAAEHLLLAAQVADRASARDQWLLTAVATLIDLGDAARARSHEAEVTATAPSVLRSLVLGRLAMLSGGYIKAEQCITDAWAELSSCEQPAAQVQELAAKAACDLALMLVGQHRLNEAASWAQRSASTAAVGFISGCSRAVQGIALAAAGHTSVARELLEAELAVSADGRGRAVLQAGLGAVLLFGDDLQGAARHLDTATATDRDPLPLAHVLEAQLARVLVAYRSGAWDEAAAAAERLVTLTEDFDEGWLLPRAHLAAVYVAAGRGQWPVAVGHLAAADGLAAPRAGPMAIALTDARVAIAVARDDVAEILAAAHDAVSDLELMRSLEPSRLSFWPAYAQALARIGQVAEADAMLRPFEERAQACGRRSAVAAAMRARGVIEAIRRRPDEAVTALDASMDCLDGLGMPMEEAMTRFERGRILRRMGQRRSAAREMSAARTVFTALGAQPFVQRCDEELRSELRAEDAAAGLPLTGRQLCVAQAAAAGKSNREIAADLFISVKTVEFHVAQILARLGLDSRTQIAAVLSSAGSRHQADDHSSRSSADGRLRPANQRSCLRTARDG
jgi:DNA-binding CsgD family transcriptional regulator